MPFTGDTYNLPDGTIISNGTLSDAAQINTPFQDIETALNTLKAGSQSADATLTALAGLATGANTLPYATGVDAFAETTLTAFARTLLDDTGKAVARQTLGLPSGTRAELKAMTFSSGDFAFLTESGREGQFIYDSSDLSAKIAPRSATSSAVAGNVVTSASHKFLSGHAVIPTTSVNGLTADTIYYAIVGTANALYFDAETANFAPGETLTGGTSGATATIDRVIDSGTTGALWLSSVSGTFEDDETITSSGSGSATAKGGIEVIRDNYTFRLASTYANAKAGTAITLSGTANFTVKWIPDVMESIYIVLDGDARDGSDGGLLRVFNGIHAVQWSGAANDNSADAAQALENAMNTARGDKIYAPVGIFRHDYELECLETVHMDGAGCGSGPGLLSKENCTIFRANYPNPNGLYIINLNDNRIEGIQFDISSAFATVGAGTAMSVLGDVGNNSKSIVRNCATDGYWRGVHMLRPTYPEITASYFWDFVDCAILQETTSTREGGGGFIENNYIFGDGTANQRAAITTRTGYTFICRNEILGGIVGVDIDIDTFPAGEVVVDTNTIENQYLIGVQGQSTNGYECSMWSIINNEFSNTSFPTTYWSSIYISDDAGTVWLQDLLIHGNIMRLTGTSPVGFIRVAAGDNIAIVNNLVHQLSGTGTLGIGVVGVNNSTSLGASPSPRVLDNFFMGNFTNRYIFSPVVPTILRHPDPIDFADIPANVANGSEVYCADGQTTSASVTTLTSGGDGCKAWYQNDNWHAFRVAA